MSRKRLVLTVAALVFTAQGGCGDEHSSGSERVEAGASQREAGAATEPAEPAVVVPHVPVAAGPQHTCLVQSSGEAYCWGRNLDSELGDGTARNRWTPVPVSGLSGVRQIDGGGFHSCAVLESGQVWCWGRNDKGQSGAGEALVTAVPHRVQGLDDVVQVTAGHDFSCALRRSKRVSCWGHGDSGRLGTGNSQDSRTPAEVVGLTGVAQIASGRQHSCAVTDAGELWCWGANTTKQSALPGDVRETPRPMKVAGLSEVVAVAAGQNTTCAIDAGGHLFCWGYNSYGMVGNGQSGPGSDVSQPTRVEGLEQVVAVDVGEYQSCALTQGGQVHCWGRDGYGNLGAAARGSRETPVEVENVADATHLAVGGQHVCVLRRGGQVACWGRSESGQLGAEAITDPYHATDVVASAEQLTAEPSAVHDLTADAEVEATPMLSVSQGFACGLRSNGVPICWGSNSSGQLGNGTTLYQRGQVVEVAGLTDVVEISAGDPNVCARRAGGTVACWGSLGRYNGSETYTRSSRPLPLEGITDAVEVALGGNQICVRHQDDTVSCDQQGQMQPVVGLTGAAQLSLGYSMACARLDRGEVWCWGRGTSGQLGQGEDESSETPVMVAGLRDARRISVGDNHGCALRRSGQVVCWGDNEDGQLGNGRRGDAERANTPVIVRGLADAVDVSAGMNQTCALRRGGEVLCWGGNTFGQTGVEVPEGQERPALVTTPAPVQPSRAPNASALGPPRALACGWHVSCLMHETARVSCWGSSAILGGGMLGGLISSRSPHPIPINGLDLRPGGSSGGQV